MVEIYNDVSSVEELVRKHNRIFLYGAGASCRLLLESFWSDVLKGHVECIIDAKTELSGTSVNINGDEIGIYDASSCVTRFFTGEGERVFLLTPAFSSLIIGYLDTIPEFDKVKVYLLPMICRRQMPSEYDLRSESVPVIPRIIHYFWIGDAPMPDEYKKNIEGWREHNPDYDIRCWNEDNYNFETIPYMSEAYAYGRDYLMFATDYARMDVLYRYGGIYLDTDVELLKSLDDLLYNRGFVGEEENAQINSGSAIGAVAKHPMIQKLMRCYEDRHFTDESGRIQKTYNTYHETKCFIDNGYKMVNSFQRVCDMSCFPREVFMPVCFAGMDDCFTDRTISIHRINPEHHKMHKAAYEKWRDRIRL